MGQADPASNLVLRIVSAVVLAPLAIIAAYRGGWPFAVFWALAAIAVLWEWTKLVAGLSWIIAGIGYAGVMLAAPMVLRHDAEFGFLAMVLLFAIVWTTDILGYFAARAFDMCNEAFHAHLSVKLRGSVPQLEINNERSATIDGSGVGDSVGAQARTNAIRRRHTANVVDGRKQPIISRVLAVTRDPLLILVEPFAK